jgi:two-component system, OmpR family, response regulator
LELSRRLTDILVEAGFVVDVAADGDQGWLMGDTENYGAVVLDLGLPRLSGLDVLKRWRAAGRKVPVLILTARSGWHERVEGLNAGADDYLEKPFQAAEVVARLRALIRRSVGNASPVLRQGSIALDVSSGLVTLGDQPVELTALELRMLTYFLHRKGRIVSQNELMDHVYAQAGMRDSNTIEVYVARLRKKLGRDVITTLRGLGYRLG